MTFSHLTYQGTYLAKWTQRTFLANSCWPPPPHLTWETCTNLWHLAESARVHTHKCSSSASTLFFCAGRDIGLTERYWDTDNYMQSGMSTHTHPYTHTYRGSLQCRTQPWKSSVTPGNFPEWPVCKSKTIARSLHLFIPLSILPSVQGKESETLIHEPWTQWTDVFLGHFSKTVKLAEIWCLVYNFEINIS